ncbi:MAG: DUF1987 domain-containing protein [Flavobacteriales bacterium]|nr:DUF1987 domain-containing protein [Flavobacteriales bacterium]
MKSLFIDGKTNTPTVSFSGDGVLSISGRSIPEHPIKFYKPIQIWLDEFLLTSPIRVFFRINLDYLNTHSTECIFAILKKLEDYYITTKADVSVSWIIDEDDDDMEIIGNDMKALLQIPIIVEEEI